jgi:hypothetical protein
MVSTEWRALKSTERIGAPKEVIYGSMGCISMCLLAKDDLHTPITPPKKSVYVRDEKQGFGDVPCRDGETGELQTHQLVKVQLSISRTEYRGSRSIALTGGLLQR